MVRESGKGRGDLATWEARSQRRPCCQMEGKKGTKKHKTNIGSASVALDVARSNGRPSALSLAGGKKGAFVTLG